MTNRRELADRLEEAALDLHPYSMGEIESPSLNCALPAYLNEAARLLREPVAEEVEAVRLLRELCGEVHISPSGYITTGSFFVPLLKEARALRALLDAEGKGGEA